MKIDIKYSSEAVYPERAHTTDAGADLRSVADHEIYPGEMALVDTGVSFKIPVGYVGLVVPRSSMGKIEVSIANTVGIIDPAYRGHIFVRLKNNGEDIFFIKKEDTRIAQILFVPIIYPKFVRCSEDNWIDTERGVGGFGSTGV